jgi:hypothetical protein
MMASKGWMIVIGVGLVLPVSAALAAATDTVPAKNAQQSTETPVPPAKPVFVYRPPNRGAPQRRVGGGTRSLGAFQLQVLAPSHLAYSAEAQPRLYWFLSPGYRNPVRFRLSKVGAPPPLLEIVLPADPSGGIRYLDLAQHDVRLAPGAVYQWAVTLDPLPHQQRWPRVLSHGSVTLAEGKASLLAEASVAERPYVAAELGLWFDAFDGISRLVAEDPSLREERAILLDQGGLGEVAAYEREMIRLTR